MSVTEQAMCLEWVIVLSVLLMDTTVLVHTSQLLQSLDTHTTFPEDTGTRLTDGIKALSVWATNSWYAATSVPEKPDCMLAVVPLSHSLSFCSVLAISSSFSRSLHYSKSGSYCLMHT